MDNQATVSDFKTLIDGRCDVFGIVAQPFNIFYLKTLGNIDIECGTSEFLIETFFFTVNHIKNVKCKDDFHLIHSSFQHSV